MVTHGGRTIGELIQVFHLSELQAPENGIDIVVIPGLWVKNVPGRKVSSECSWLKLLVASTDHDTRVFVFKYDVETKKDSSVWQQQIRQHQVLLDALRQARPYEFQRRSLFFICHSLGGILLKEALFQAQRSYRTLYNALAGVIFLGTPHLRSVHDERWDNWRLILKLFRREDPKIALSNKDIETMSGVCKRFKKLELRIPVLSVYETALTKVRDSGAIGRGPAVDRVLVDRTLSTTNVEREELCGVNASHAELQDVEAGSPLFTRLVQYFKEAPVQGQNVVTETLQRLRIELDLSETQSHVSLRLPGANKETKLVDAANAKHYLFSEHNFAPQVRQVLLPCHSLGQSRDQSFVGQDSFLHRIDDVLTPRQPSKDQAKEPSTPKSFAICGMGGLGKSWLAVEYVHSRKDKFEAIFWVNSASTQRLDAGFRDIAVKLGLQSELEVSSDDPAATREVVKAWLQNPQRTLGADLPESESDSQVEWLIVFDNADDPDLLLNFWPANGTGSILITSRDPLAKHASFANANMSGIDLPPMLADDAAHLLLKTSGREAEVNSLESCLSIVDRLGMLPLAVAQTAYFIRTKFLSLSEFIEYYDQDSERLQNLPIPGLTGKQTLALVWNIEALPPSALALLRVISVLDPDLIQDNVLTAGAKDVALDEYPREKVEYFEARQVLIKSSLVARNVELGFLKIHRLVQEVVRQKMSIDELRTVYDAAVTLVSTVWPFIDETNLHNVERLRKVQQYFSHVLAFQSVLKEKAPDALRPNIKVAALFNEASWRYILQTRDYNLRDGREIALLSQKVLEAVDDEPDEQLRSKLLADSYRYHCISSIHSDDDQAIPSGEKWIALLVDRIANYQESVDIKTLPIAYNEIGMAYMRASDQEAALKTWNLSCDTLLQLTKEGDLPFPYPWVHRALILAYSGDPEAAYQLVSPILEAREKKLGVNDTTTIETGRILSYVGTFLLLLGRKEEAYSLRKRGAEALKVTTGENSSFYNQASYRVARDYFERSKYEEAAVLLERCIKFAGDVPWFQPEGARATWKLGRTLEVLGGTENRLESRRLLVKAMELRQELAPDDDRPESDLVDKDWDELVYYFYR